MRFGLTFGMLLLLSGALLAQCRVDMNPPLAVKVTWTYVSANSTALGIKTTRAARTHVEYGKTEELGEKTAPTDLHFQHLHHLKELEPGNVYHFRAVAVDADGKRQASPVATLEPKVVEGAVRIPEDMPAGPPYVLDRPKTHYLVTKDLTCDGTAFEIKASDVTLDLNGHVVVYDNRELPRPERNFRAFRDETSMGVRIVLRGKGVRILNGTIMQGAANSAGTVPGIGYNPLYTSGATVEVGGVEAIWSGDDVSGFFLHWGEGHEVHHCVLEDRGSHITNRHQAIRNIGGNGALRVHHCLSKRSRHRGFNNCVEAAYNEIHVDSQATNAFGIVVKKDGASIHHNRIYGRGEHPIGIGATGDVRNIRVFANYVQVRNTKGSAEYGNTGSACYRMTWGGEADDVEVYDNVFVVHAKKDAFEWKGRKQDSWGRALWVGLPVKEEEPGRTRPRVLVHHNTIIATNAGDGAKAAGIAVVCANETPLLVFEENRVESNWANVVLSDSYGWSGGYPKFIRNTFVKVGDVPGYATVKNDYGPRPATAEFIGNQYENGASPDSVSWQKPFEGHVKEIRVSHHLSLTVRDARGAIEGAAVTIKDTNASVVFEGRTGAGGKLEAIVSERSVKPTGTAVLTPHTVTVISDGRTVTEKVTLEASKQMTLVVK